MNAGISGFQFWDFRIAGKNWGLTVKYSLLPDVFLGVFWGASPKNPFKLSIIFCEHQKWNVRQQYFFKKISCMLFLLEAWSAFELTELK